MISVAELCGHNNYVNTIGWAPNSSYHICTAGDDAQTLIWDLSLIPRSASNAAENNGTYNYIILYFYLFNYAFNLDPIEPILAYQAEGEICTLQWPAPNPGWVSIAFTKKVQMLKV
jgi:DDB1- and CUL4-associated factor 7